MGVQFQTRSPELFLRTDSAGKGSVVVDVASDQAQLLVSPVGEDIFARDRLAACPDESRLVGLSRFLPRVVSRAVAAFPEASGASEFVGKFIAAYQDFLSPAARRSLIAKDARANPETELAFQALSYNLCNYLQNRLRHPLALLAVTRILHDVGLEIYEDRSGIHIVTRSEYETQFHAGWRRPVDGAKRSVTKMTPRPYEEIFASQADEVRVAIGLGQEALTAVSRRIFYPNDEGFASPQRIRSLWNGLFVLLSSAETATLLACLNSSRDVIRLIQAVYQPDIGDALVEVRLLSALARLPLQSEGGHMTVTLEGVLENLLIDTATRALGVSLLCESQFRLGCVTDRRFYSAYESVQKRHESWFPELIDVIVNGQLTPLERRLFFVSANSLRDRYLLALGQLGRGSLVTQRLDGIRELGSIAATKRVGLHLLDKIALVLLREMAATEPAIQMAAQKTLLKIKRRLDGDVADAVQHVLDAVAAIDEALHIGDKAKLKTHVERDDPAYACKAFVSYVALEKDLRSLTWPTTLDAAGIELEGYALHLSQLYRLRELGAQVTGATVCAVHEDAVIPFELAKSLIEQGGRFEGTGAYRFQIEARHLPDLKALLRLGGRAIDVALRFDGGALTPSEQVDLVRTVLATDENGVKAEVIPVLQKIATPDAVAELIALSMDGEADRYVRTGAFAALLDLNEAVAKGIHDQLSHLAGNPDKDTRRQAIQSLQDYGTRSIQYIKDLLAVEQDDHRILAVAILSDIVGSQEAFQLLKNQFLGGGVERQQVVFEMIRIDAIQAGIFFIELGQIPRREDKDIVIAALSALGELGSRGAIEALDTALCYKRTGPRTRRAAFDAVLKLEKSRALAIFIRIIDPLGDRQAPDEGIFLAIEGVARIGDPVAIDALVKRVTSSGSGQKFCESAFDAIIKIGGPQALDGVAAIVTGGVNSDWWQIRIKAANHLAQHGSRRHIDALRRQAEYDGRSDPFRALRLDLYAPGRSQSDERPRWKAMTAKACLDAIAAIERR